MHCSTDAQRHVDVASAWAWVPLQVRQSHRKGFAVKIPGRARNFLAFSNTVQLSLLPTVYIMYQVGCEP
jgi:hypothetical protein